MKNIIPVVYDTFFCTLIAFIVLNFTLSSFMASKVSLILAITLSLLLSLLFYKTFYNKYKKNYTKNTQSREIKNLVLKLSLMKKKEQIKFFEDLFSSINVKFKTQNEQIYLTEHGFVIFLAFNFDGLNKSKILKSFNLLTSDEIGVIFTGEICNDVRNFAENFAGKIKLVSSVEIYELCKRANLFPTNDICFFVEKEKKWDFSSLLNKKRAKKYFFFGIIFMLYSFIVPIKFYYVLIGSLFLIFSLAVKLFGKTENENN